MKEKVYEWLDVLRIFLSFSFLAASSWYDLKTREVPNRMWLLFAPLGFMLSFANFLLTKEDSFLIFWLLSSLVTAGLSLVLFYLGFFGGADAKALICLSIALPGYPSSASPLLKSLSPLFPLAVLSNALLGSLALVFMITAYNLSRLIQSKGKMFEGLENEPLWKKALAFMIGFKIDSDRLKGVSHYIPLQYFSKDADGRIIQHLRISPRLEEEAPQKNEASEDFSEEAGGKIWATPGLPFLVFVTAGFVVTLVIGDIISWLAIQIVAPRVV